MTSHLDDGTIQELLDGEVPSTVLPPLQAHLAACAECRARLELARAMMAEADELIELLDEPAAPVQAPPVALPAPRAASRPWVRQLAWAASVVVAVGAGWYARGDVERVLPAPIAVPVTTTEAVVSSAAPSEASGAAPTPVTPPAAAVVAQTKPAAQNTTEMARDLAAAESRAEKSQVMAAPPPAAADTSRQRLAPTATMGGGLPVTGAMRERGARTDLVARDQVATKQLLDVAVMTDTLAIRIAAMRSVLESYFGSLDPSAGGEISVICVAFSASQDVGTVPVGSRDGDLSAETLAMLPKAPRPFRPGSACTTSSVSPMPVIEAATGRPALELLVGEVRIGAVRIGTPETATVGVQLRHHGRSGGGYRCEVVRREGGWVATSCRGTWVS
ncbi:MAG TPA: hypothetical protein PLJ23_01485 [Gemmatimonadales bacterium]|nr:hypothetical protein [Gemmatimonadales bacterium]